MIKILIAICSLMIAVCLFLIADACLGKRVFHDGVVIYKSYTPSRIETYTTIDSKGNTQTHTHYIPEEYKIVLKDTANNKIYYSAVTKKSYYDINENETVGFSTRQGRWTDWQYFPNIRL